MISSGNHWLKICTTQIQFQNHSKHSKSIQNISETSANRMYPIQFKLDFDPLLPLLYRSSASINWEFFYHLNEIYIFKLEDNQTESLNIAADNIDNLIIET